ncbi:AAEL007133-PA [Aedes aegypti]|uniref:MADF domain-containing protein n=2 Tax=Aedes aegypti TaxID=7159 RepID=Q173I6_AEDAE|nr:uncharacterized protein LOC5568789 [Aedes aegypti]XP_021698337.1 uncharacterized protein LOC110676104 [Aedes aegypti]EAT41210.1 AAEL007133-PA [Aedes aegypti]
MEYADVEFLELGEFIDLSPPDFDTEATEASPDVSPPAAAGKRQKKRRRTDFFSSEDKKQLAAAVKGRPEIWDLSNRDHYNSGAIDRAWREIAKQLNRTCDMCKTAWISLRESHRYRKKIVQKKSGSEGGEPLPGPSSSCLEWEFAEDLSFLPDTSRKRKTFSTTKQSESAAHEIEQERTEEEGRTNYFYQSPRSENKKPSKEDDSLSVLASNITSLIDYSKTLEDSPLVFQTALANIDRVLQRLSPDVAEDAIYEMTTLLYRKIKEQQQL